MPALRPVLCIWARACAIRRIVGDEAGSAARTRLLLPHPAFQLSIHSPVPRRNRTGQSFCLSGCLSHRPTWAGILLLPGLRPSWPGNRKRWHRNRPPCCGRKSEAVNSVTSAPLPLAPSSTALTHSFRIARTTQNTTAILLIVVSCFPARRQCNVYIFSPASLLKAYRRSNSASRSGAFLAFGKNNIRPVPISIGLRHPEPACFGRGRHIGFHIFQVVQPGRRISWGATCRQAR